MTDGPQTTDIETGAREGDWMIESDYVFSAKDDDTVTCKHCHSRKVGYWPGIYDRDKVITEVSWVCPRVVRAVSWGDALAICLDCLLEAIPHE